MKKLFYITSLIVLSCVIASSAIITITKAPESVKGSAYTESAGDEYIIKSLGDRIVVYKGKEAKPYIQTNRSVSSLPMDIQHKLNRGIPYGSEKSMRDALNEFCS